MFDIGWSELLVLAVVAIIVVGPKDLPKLMRSIGHYAGKLRRTASDFQHQFEEAMRESEVEEMRKALNAEALDLNAPVDRPLMLPAPPAGATKSDAAPAPKRKRGPAKPKNGAKPKTVRAKRAKQPAKPAEPA
jgi:sec-independent protein translocase protein TatB